MKKIEPFQQLEPFPKPEPINERIDDINDNFAKIKTALAEAGNALPSDIVTSVNSKTGDVVLAWKDIAGEPTVDGGLAVKGGLTLDAQDVGDVPGNKAATQDYVAKMIAAKAAPADHVGSGGEDQHMLATNEVAGFMSPADKAKLDNLPDQVVSAVESVNGHTGVVNLQFSDIQGKLQTTGAELGDSAATTQPAGNATNKIATTKFVHDAINESGVPRSHIGSGGDAHAIVTKDAAGFMSPEQLAKLDGLAELAEGGNAVVSVNGQTGAVVLDAGAVGARPSDWMPPEATTTVSGLLSKEDKQKLNRLSNAVLDGTGLMRIDGSTSMQGNLNLAGQRVMNVKNPEHDTDAVNRRTMNAAIAGIGQGFMRTNGSTPMTGNLSMSDNKIIGLGDATNSKDAVNLQTLHREISGAQGFLKTDGSNAMLGHLQMNDKRVQGLAEPENDTDAATKRYVATSVADATNGFVRLNEHQQLAMNNKRIVGIDDPVDDQDAVNFRVLKQRVQGVSAGFLKTDGTSGMQGTLYMNNNTISNLKRSEHADQAVNRAELDEVRVLAGQGSGDFKSDGTLPMTGNFNAGGHRVTGLANPVGSSDAVSLGYAQGAFIKNAPDSYGSSFTGMNTGLDFRGTYQIRGLKKASERTDTPRLEDVWDLMNVTSVGTRFIYHQHDKYIYFNGGVATSTTWEMRDAATGYTTGYSYGVDLRRNLKGRDGYQAAIVELIFHNIGNNQDNLPDDLKIWAEFEGERTKREVWGPTNDELSKLNGRGSKCVVLNQRHLESFSPTLKSNYTGSFWCQVGIIIQYVGYGTY